MRSNVWSCKIRINMQTVFARKLGVPFTLRLKAFTLWSEIREASRVRFTA